MKFNIIKSPRVLSLIFFFLSMNFGFSEVFPLIDSENSAVNLQKKYAADLNLPIEWVNKSGIVFRLIPAGRYKLGDVSSALFREVVITKPYYLGKFEVSRKEYEKITNKKNSDYYPGENKPINYIRWHDTRFFLKKLNALEGTKRGKGYRLPTEAEWEAAARGGVQPGEGIGDNKTFWTTENSLSQIKDVGLSSSNAYGLFDMLGNIWEWCFDIYNKNSYNFDSLHDPKGAKNSLYGYRVIRGGSVCHNISSASYGLRSFYQGGRSERWIGFRIAILAENVQVGKE